MTRKEGSSRVLTMTRFAPVLAALVPIFAFACQGATLDVGSSSGDAGASDDAIAFPLVTSLTGRDQALGQSVKKGAELAIDTINAAGGVRGKRLRLDVLDDASAPETAKRVFASLLASGRPWGVGPLINASAVASRAELAQGAFLSATVTLFRDAVIDQTEEPPPDPALSLNLGALSAATALAQASSLPRPNATVRLCNSIALVGEAGVDEGLGGDLVERRLKLLALGVQRFELARGASDAAIESMLNEVYWTKADCQGLFLGDTLAPYLRAFAARGVSAPPPKTILVRSLRAGQATSPIWRATEPNRLPSLQPPTSAFPFPSGSSIVPEGGIVLAPLLDVDATTPPQTSAFSDRFTQRFGTAPDEASASAFDATMLVALALQRAGADAPATALRAAIENLRSQGRRVTFLDGAEVFRAAQSGEDLALRGVTGSLEGRTFLARDIGVFRRSGDGYVLETQYSLSALGFE